MSLAAIIDDDHERQRLEELEPTLASWERRLRSHGAELGGVHCSRGVWSATVSVTGRAEARQGATIIEAVERAMRAVGV